MTSSLDAAIIPITLTINGRIGLTLWAPPWEDDEGEEWQGFLGDGAKILLFPNTRELADFIASGEENDLSDHPAWGRVLRLTPDDLRPSGDDAYNLDDVYTWAAGEPDPVHVSALGNVIDLVSNIADCCDDGALRGLVQNTPAYAELVDEDISYQGKEGRKRWSELGDVIAETWERALTRVDSWLTWRGDFSDTDLDAETEWDRIGAEPIEIIIGDRTYFTVRGHLTGEADGETIFLGDDNLLRVFTDLGELAEYCRSSSDHRFATLERWNELADADDEMFRPALGSTYDLNTPSASGRELLAELTEFLGLAKDADWDASVHEISENLQVD